MNVTFHVMGICPIIRFFWWLYLILFSLQVSFYMPNRTKEQCYQRWAISVKKGIWKGRFNEIEDFIIIIGVKLFGKKWAKIADYVPHRGASQVFSR